MKFSQQQLLKRFTMPGPQQNQALRDLVKKILALAKQLGRYIKMRLIDQPMSILQKLYEALLALQSETRPPPEVQDPEPVQPIVINEDEFRAPITQILRYPVQRQEDTPKEAIQLDLGETPAPPTSALTNAPLPYPQYAYHEPDEATTYFWGFSRNNEDPIEEQHDCTVMELVRPGEYRLCFNQPAPYRPTYLGCYPTLDEQPASLLFHDVTPSEPDACPHGFCCQLLIDPRERCYLPASARYCSDRPTLQRLMRMTPALPLRWLYRVDENHYHISNRADLPCLDKTLFEPKFFLKRIPKVLDFFKSGPAHRLFRALFDDCIQYYLENSLELSIRYWCCYQEDVPMFHPRMPTRHYIAQHRRVEYSIAGLFQNSPNPSQYLHQVVLPRIDQQMDFAGADQFPNGFCYLHLVKPQERRGVIQKDYTPGEYDERLGILNSRTLPRLLAATPNDEIPMLILDSNGNLHVTNDYLAAQRHVHTPIWPAAFLKLLANWRTSVHNQPSKTQTWELFIAAQAVADANPQMYARVTQRFCQLNQNPLQIEGPSH